MMTGEKEADEVEKQVEDLNLEGNADATAPAKKNKKKNKKKKKAAGDGGAPAEEDAKDAGKNLTIVLYGWSQKK